MEPPPGTLQRWAWDYVTASTLQDKFVLAPAPRIDEPSPVARASVRPGRDPSLEVVSHATKSPGREALRIPSRRAQLFHTFLHHELQAAELMCWAILAFPDAPLAFRTGLASIARDEVRHMGLYREHLERLGVHFGALAVRDWFWQRVPTAATPVHFVATLGMGLEGANLDHAARFTAWLREAGDETAAAIQQQVGDEEVAHVRFALHWFRHWTGCDDFAAWTAHLAPPLTPLLMRGAPLERAARSRAGFSDTFVDRLARWQPDASGC